MFKFVFLLIKSWTICIYSQYFISDVSKENILNSEQPEIKKKKNQRQLCLNVLVYACSTCCFITLIREKDKVDN